MSITAKPPAELATAVLTAATWLLDRRIYPSPDRIAARVGIDSVTAKAVRDQLERDHLIDLSPISHLSQSKGLQGCSPAEIAEIERRTAEIREEKIKAEEIERARSWNRRDGGGTIEVTTSRDYRITTYSGQMMRKTK